MKINEMIKNILNENELDFNSGYAFLWGMIGALIIFITMHFFISPPTKFAKVNITSIVDQFIKQEAAKNLPESALKNEVHIFGKKLEVNLQQFAKKNHLILLPSEAVIAGAPDYTSVIKSKLKEFSDESVS